MPGAKNVLGTDLAVCCMRPMTGWLRTGRCDTGGGDIGVHVVCVRVTAEFLAFSASRGNDLSTPSGDGSFPGLKPGDCWCLCAMRWQEAFDAGMAPQVRLESTHMRAIEFVNLEDLKAHALPRKP